jgi:hypothetical protein
MGVTLKNDSFVSLQASQINTGSSSCRERKSFVGIRAVQYTNERGLDFFVGMLWTCVGYT